MEIPTRDEVTQRINKIDEQKYVHLKSKVISALESNYGNMAITVDIRNFNRRVIDRVIGELEKRGWQAKVIYDQRDGDFLQIK